MVAPANEAFALASQRAGEDARARADQYAQALSIELGPVVWAAEPGLRSTGHTDLMAAPFGHAMSAGAIEEPISVTPEEITIAGCP
jgi:uncharacterized protein YggE